MRTPDSPGIVKHDPVGIDLPTYKHVKVSVKGKKTCAWLQVRLRLVGIPSSHEFNSRHAPALIRVRR